MFDKSQEQLIKKKRKQNLSDSLENLDSCSTTSITTVDTEEIQTKTKMEFNIDSDITKAID